MQTEGAGAGTVRRLTPRAPGPEVVARTSVERGRGPRPGVVSAPFFWGDVLEESPPRRAARGEGTFAVYHATEVDPDTRITYSTLVSTSAGPDPAYPREGGIAVDSRVAVQRRLFFELIDRERAMMERATSSWRGGLIRNLVRQRRRVQALPYRWMRRTGLAVVRAEGRAGLWSIRAAKRASNVAVQAPDRLFSQALRVWLHVYDRMGRRSLWSGMRDPRGLSTEQKSVVLFLSSALLLGVMFLLNNVIPLLFPSATTAYRDLLATFALGLATAVLLPFPPSELLVVKPYLSAGPALAFLSIVASKVAGAWLVFFVGDALTTVIARRTEGRPRLERTVAWMNRNSRRYGAYILATCLAAPFLPDTLALYVFAVSGMTLRSYLVAATVGSVIRFGAVVAILMLYGEARLEEIFG